MLVAGRRRENTEETAALIQTSGGAAEPLVADAATEEGVPAMVARALDVFGSLDVSFANAGDPGVFTPLVEQTVEDWNHVWRVNVVSCFLAIKHDAPPMIGQGAGSAGDRRAAGAVEMPLANHKVDWKRHGHADVR